MPGLRLDDRYSRELPADSDKGIFPRQVFEAAFSYVLPVQVREARLLAVSGEVAASIGLSAETASSEAFVQLFSGNALVAGMRPYAMCYGGHQFGSWAGQLGDGRAINLGEVIDIHGAHQTLQLKGAGPTPYSRRADGLAVLRSSLREFLCSEAMHHLGVPTTRALSLMTTGEGVVRDMFYDGHPRAEPGAVICRVAPTFIRFGSFEIFAARSDIERLNQLAGFTLRRYFPHLGEPSRETYLAWFSEVGKRTIETVLHWQRVGFVHAVMNTDNMSILGLTLDYGPYGWLENYDPDWTPNTTDAGGRRYRYAHQPWIALWNLARLAKAIAPLIEDVASLEAILRGCRAQIEAGLEHMIASKFGFAHFAGAADLQLHEMLLDIFAGDEIDMTIFYRGLADLGQQTADDELIDRVLSALYAPDAMTTEHRARLQAWLRRYLDRVACDGLPDEQRRARMNAVNPKYVLRNYLAQQAIDAAEIGDRSMLHELSEVLRTPYDEQPGREHLAQKRPEWARARAGCSMLSCSS